MVGNNEFDFRFCLVFVLLCVILLVLFCSLISICFLLWFDVFIILCAAVVLIIEALSNSHSVEHGSRGVGVRFCLGAVFESISQSDL